MGGAFNLYEKKPFPKFTWKKREYLGFRREWTEVVILRNPNQKEFLVRKISRHIPAEMEPDIKNLHTMAEVWNVLNKEYGVSEELVNESVGSLANFSFTAGAKTIPDKFRELYLRYKQVKNNLVEVNRLEVLNHEPTLWSVIKKLPSQD